MDAEALIDREELGRVGGAKEDSRFAWSQMVFEDAAGDVSDRFAALGASTNAMTGFTSTTYVVSTLEAPGECLDLLLDFVQDPWFTDALVAKEQGIIAQEIRMYDDDPEWRLFFGLMGCLYERHPVKDNIAGSVESIAAIDAAVLRRCYDRFYHPRNLCLAISSALDPQNAARVEADQAGRPARRAGAAVSARVDEHDGRARRASAAPALRATTAARNKDIPRAETGPAARCELAEILLDALLGPSSRLRAPLRRAWWTRPFRPRTRQRLVRILGTSVRHDDPDAPKRSCARCAARARRGHRPRRIPPVRKRCRGNAA